MSALTAHPALDRDEEVTRAAREAIVRLVAELQQGMDEHDAEISDRSLAGDVLWGSPFGRTLGGYEPLHDIHARMKARASNTSSRFELEQMLVPAPDVAIAHVRRTSLDAAGEPVPVSDDSSGPFSEMAMYVLVRRDGHWWLAAGHNTPIRPGGELR